MSGERDPSPEALSVGRDLLFEALVEVCDLTMSYTLSAREAAWRGNARTVEIHLRQLRDCTVELIRLHKELGSGPDEKARAA